MHARIFELTITGWFVSSPPAVPCLLYPQASITPAFWGLRIRNNFQQMLELLKKVVAWSTKLHAEVINVDTLDAVWCACSQCSV